MGEERGGIAFGFGNNWIWWIIIILIVIIIFCPGIFGGFGFGGCKE
ncbi:MAG: hypothetical protein Q8920_08605 [Bacillota bacterium]|nr:hypothetical protein [Bacillota bacterium]